MRASNHRPGGGYQGYPYTKPPVHDAPTIDSATASRWNNLPRKQVELPVRRTEPVVYVSMPDGHEDAEARNESLIGQGRLPQKPDPDPSPVVYIDMPEASGSHVSDRKESLDSDEFQNPGPSGSGQELKRDPADDPVVYIDLPEGNGSDVAQSPQNEEPEFVQETIFFDPFENRRIEMHKDESLKRGDSESEDDVSTVSSHSIRHRPLPPIRPSTLDLYGPGSSSGASSSNMASTSTPGLSSIMSKETMMYQGDEDRFPMSPIPVSEFPEPPPAYTEIDRVSSPVVEPSESVPEASRVEPPRTQVILPRDQGSTPMGMPNTDRKYLNCHHCGMRVHTLVIRENGTITHATALMCLFFCMIPIVILIYCKDFLKIKNHYCPSCNKIIGYELPFSGNKIIYVN